MKGFLKNSFFVLTSNILSKIFGFFTLAILSKNLSSETFGNFSAIQNSANASNMIGSLGIPIVLQLKVASISIEKKQDLNAVISNSIILYLFTNIVICIILFQFPAIFTKFLLNASLDHKYNIHLIYLILLSGVNQLPLFILTGFGEFKEYALRNIGYNSLTVFSTYLFITFYGKSLNSALGALYVSNLLLTIFSFFIIRKIVKKYDLHINFRPDLLQIKSIIKNGFIYYLGNTLLVALTGIFTISIFYKYLSADQYAYLRIASAITIILGVLPSAIQPVNLSKIFINGNQNSLKSLQFRIIPFITIVLFLIISPNLGTIISLLFGAEYVVGSQFIFLIMLLQIPTIYLGVISNFLTASGALNFIGLVAVVGTISLIGALYFLVPEYKLNGYVYSVLASTAISLFVVFYKEINSNRYLQKVDLISVILNSSIVSALYYMFSYNHLNGLSIMFFSGAIYITLFYKFCINKSEKLILKKNVWRQLSIFLKK